ncbi:MAG: hydantoinase/oxoprolinase family protein, partial [Pseudomonadota bacterium]
MRLGIDVGGTFSDAVLVDETGAVIFDAKSPTTRPDPTLGLRQLLQNLFEQAAIQPAQISMFNLSTTLATNAIIEGMGAPAGLISIGQSASLLKRAHIEGLIQPHHICMLAGGHDSNGDIQEALDLKTLASWCEAHQKSVRALAICGLFSVRNPAHEREVESWLGEHCDLPVTCGHELAAGLGAPVRVLTSLLNARLIPFIANLLDGICNLALEFGINAPIMIVRGDGSIVEAQLARTRPVETILSGPAAGVIGARHLTGLDDALIADLGGTTLDVATIEGGLPELSHQRTLIANHRISVRAISMQTFALGGDSGLHIEHDTNTGIRIQFGPYRAIPLGTLARKIPAVRQQIAKAWQDPDCSEPPTFWCALGGDSAGDLTQAQAHLYHAMEGKGALGAQQIEAMRGAAFTLAQLRASALAIESRLTPTDCLIATGHLEHEDRKICQQALGVLARRIGVRSWRQAARLALQHFTRQGTEKLTQYLLPESLGRLAESESIARALAGWAADERAQLGAELVLRRPMIGIGAPAKALLSECAARLSSRLLVPEKASVANAVGAAVAEISWQSTLEVIQPQPGLFRIIGCTEPDDFTDLESAIETARTLARELARQGLVSARGTNAKDT